MSMKQLFSHEMHLVDAIGGHVHFTPHEVLHFMTQSKSIGFFAIAILGLAVTDPPGLLDRLIFPLALVVWIVALLGYLILYNLLLICVAALQRAVSNIPAYLPLVSLIALLPCIYLSETVAHALSGTRDPLIFDRIIFDYLSAQTFELVFIRFVLPSLNLGKGTFDKGLPVPASQATDAVLHLGRSRIAVSGLLHLTAQEHYVRVTHDDGASLHRARLSDVIAQTTPLEGCQPHRSWWVARRSNPILEREGARLFLRLKDDTIVPVARGRITEVRDWLNNGSAWGNGG